MPTNSTFIIADNHDLTRAGMRSFILRAVNGGIIDDVYSKKELSGKMTERKTGIVVLDYTTFDFRGIEDFLVLHKRFPEFSWVLCSGELSENFIRRAGVEENIGIVFKESSTGDIIHALESATHGSRHLCREAAAVISSTPGHHVIEDKLTPAEIEILKMIARGMSVKEIAAERVSSVHTVTTHKKNIFRKLGVNNVYEATKYALRAGLLEMMEYYI